MLSPPPTEEEEVSCLTSGSRALAGRRAFPTESEASPAGKQPEGPRDEAAGGTAPS